MIIQSTKSTGFYENKSSKGLAPNNGQLEALLFLNELQEGESPIATQMTVLQSMSTPCHVDIKSEESR